MIPSLVLAVQQMVCCPPRTSPVHNGCEGTTTHRFSLTRSASIDNVGSKRVSPGRSGGEPENKPGTICGIALTCCNDAVRFDARGVSGAVRSLLLQGGRVVCRQVAFLVFLAAGTPAWLVASGSLFPAHGLLFDVSVVVVVIAAGPVHVVVVCHGRSLSAGIRVVEPAGFAWLQGQVCAGRLCRGGFIWPGTGQT